MHGEPPPRRADRGDPTQENRPAAYTSVRQADDSRRYDVRPWLALTLSAVVGWAVLRVRTSRRRDTSSSAMTCSAASFARQARQKQAYEDRIASLRADIDRLSEPAAPQSGGVRGEGSKTSRAARPCSTSGGKSGRHSAGRPRARARRSRARTRLREPEPRRTTTSPRKYRAVHGGDPRLTLDVVETSLDGLAEIRFPSWRRSRPTQPSDRRRIAAVLDEIGRDIPKQAGNEDAVSGPFIPMPSDVDPETFRDGVELAAAQVKRFETPRKPRAGCR